MTRIQKKSLNTPDELRPIEKGTVEVVTLEGGTSLMRLTFQPGWRWSECVKPIAGTDSCQVHHIGYTISGHMRVHMDDGTEMDIGPGDGHQIPPGHDAWILGNQPFVSIDFRGVHEYATNAAQR